MANPMVKFRFGEYAGFKALTSWESGALYVTTDEQGIYFSKDGNAPVKLGNIITYDNLKGFTDATKPPYNADVFYYITDDNALLKYNGTKFVQLNKDYGDDVAGLLAAVGSKEDTVATKETLWAYINKAQSTADSANTLASTANTAAGNAQTTANNALAKANANAGNITTINSNIGTINGEIDDLQAIVVSGANSNAKLREAIEANATAASNAQTKANQAYTLAEQADGKADTNAGEISTIKGNITTINNNIDEVEGDISDINTAIGSDSESGTIKGRIKANEEAIAANGSAISTIQSTYATKTYADQKASAAESAAKSHAESQVAAAKTELIGTEVTGNTSTIKGVKKYTDEQISAVNTTINTLKNDIGNLSNIMNFRGTFTSTDAVSNPVHGDVIIVNGVEYVYVKADASATGVWEEFGAATANEARFVAIEEAAEALEARVTALDKTDGRVAVLENGLSSANDSIAANTSAINTEKGRVDILVNTTIPGINDAIDDVEQTIADEESRAKGVESGLRTDVDTIKNTTIPGMQTAHNTLAGRVTAAEGEIDTLQSDVSTLKTKTGIANLTGSDTLYSLITAETSRATAEEADIRTDFATADAALQTEFNAALTWGTF